MRNRLSAWFLVELVCVVAVLVAVCSLLSWEWAAIVGGVAGVVIVEIHGKPES